MGVLGRDSSTAFGECVRRNPLDELCSLLRRHPTSADARRLQGVPGAQCSGVRGALRLPLDSDSVLLSEAPEQELGVMEGLSLHLLQKGRLRTRRAGSEATGEAVPGASGAGPGLGRTRCPRGRHR